MTPKDDNEAPAAAPGPGAGDGAGPLADPDTAIGLGCMGLSIEGRPDRADAKAVLRRAVEGGVRLFDSADVYALDDADIGHNERLLAEALREAGADLEGGRVLVATKGGRTRPGGGWGIDARPERLRQACEASLRALGVEAIPLYYLHTPDPRVPLAESVGALARLREEGKIRAIGLSNVTVPQVVEAARVAPVQAVQNRFSAWDLGGRTGPLIDHCATNGILFVAYGPLGGAGRARALLDDPGLGMIGDSLGATPTELVLAALTRLAPNVVPIPGATRMESIESVLRASRLRLDDETVRAIGRACRRLPGRAGVFRRALGVIRRSLSG